MKVRLNKRQQKATGTNFTRMSSNINTSGCAIQVHGDDQGEVKLKRRGRGPANNTVLKRQGSMPGTFYICNK